MSYRICLWVLCRFPLIGLSCGAYAETEEMIELSAAAYCNLGNVYSIQGDLNKGIEIYEKAIQIYQSRNNQEGLARNYGNIGTVYETFGELDKAIEMHEKGWFVHQSCLSSLISFENFSYRQSASTKYSTSLWL